MTSTMASQGHDTFVVMCAPVVAVTATLKEVHPNGRVVVKYVYHKAEHVETYALNETYVAHGVSVYTLDEATRTPCLLPLPQPFNSVLRYGSTLLFRVRFGKDFTSIWNEACMSSLTWQHNRPKKTDDPLQKLGLPPKLNDYLRDQLTLNGLDVPLLSDDETTDQLEGVAEESVYNTSSGSESEDTNIEYYTGNDEDDMDQEEEEMEDEQEPEAEEIDEGEDNE